ncbi:hypothetical protein ABE488_15390, partial [Luteimonas sp. TWI662]|uniref:hypothetical protein n=1 Tax=Luteimonas sp. TWI662 TaxID=3136789 RepID=UPI00320823E1
AVAARHARRAAAALSRAAASSGTATIKMQRLTGALLDVAALLERHADGVPPRERGAGHVA